MTTAHAYVLGDGEVVSKSYMDGYALKAEGGSNQISADPFTEAYDEKGLVKPLYDPGMLAGLMEKSTWHLRAIRTKAHDIGGSGWTLQPDPGVEQGNEQEKERATAFFEHCHPTLTLTEITDRVIADQETTGNGYFEVIREGAAPDGYPVGLEHVPAQTVRIHNDGKRYVQQRGQARVWFKAFGADNDVDKTTGELHPLGSLDAAQRATEVLHMRIYSPRSDYYGVPDVIAALGAIRGDQQAHEYNISFFENHAIPAYAVTLTGADLDKDTKSQIKDFFQNKVKQNRHSTLVLTAKPPEGATDAPPVEFNFEKLSTDTKEASFTVYRQQNRDEILSAHGVPPYRAGIVVEGQLGGSAADESTEIYKQSVVGPKQFVLEARFNRFIIRDALQVQDWTFQFDEIDTRDERADIDRDIQLFGVGYYSPNELRERYGLDAVDAPGMDQHFINGTPVDAAVQDAEATGQAVQRSVKALHADLVAMVGKGSE